jgi:hypothetical protein
LPAIITVVVIVIAAFAYFNSQVKPKTPNTSEKMYSLGASALQTTDDCISNKITAGEAKKRLDTAYLYADLQYDADIKELGQESTYNTKYSNDYFISTAILWVKFAVSDKANGTGTLEAIEKERRKLAEALKQAVTEAGK